MCSLASIDTNERRCSTGARASASGVLGLGKLMSS